MELKQGRALAAPRSRGRRGPPRDPSSEPQALGHRPRPSPPPGVKRSGGGARKSPRPRTAQVPAAARRPVPPAAYLRCGGSRRSAAGRRARPPPARTASGRAGTARKLRAAAPGHRVSGRPARPRTPGPGPRAPALLRRPGLPCRTCRWLMAAARPAARPRRAALCTRRPGNGAEAAPRGGAGPRQRRP